MLRSARPININTAVSLGSEIDSALAEERVAAAIRSLLDGENKGDIRHAYKVLKACLKDQDPTLMHLGMAKVISKNGRVGWVKNDPAIIQSFIVSKVVK